MYYNVFGEKVSRRRFKEMCNAAKNRRELIAAGLTSRRDLFKMGLLTSGGMLIAKSGLSARAYGQVATDQPASSGTNTSPGTNQNCVPGNQTQSPQTRPFLDPLVVMPLARKVTALSPTPTLNPNTGAGEVRAAAFQAPLDQSHTVSGRPRYLVSIQPAAVHRAPDGRHHAASPDLVGIRRRHRRPQPGPDLPGFLR